MLWSQDSPPTARGGAGRSAQRLCNDGAFDATLSGPSALTGMAAGQIHTASSTFEAKVLGCSCPQAFVNEPLRVGVIGWAVLGHPEAQTHWGPQEVPSPEALQSKPGLRRGATRGPKLPKPCSGLGRELRPVLTP